MSPEELEELAGLERELRVSGLGDRPHSPAVAKLRRYFDLVDMRDAVRAQVEAGYQNTIVELSAMLGDKP